MYERKLNIFYELSFWLLCLVPLLQYVLITWSIRESAKDDKSLNSKTEPEILASTLAVTLIQVVDVTIALQIPRM